jgi:pimeloyl-ACP methyl ester carboxylesterase
MHNEEASWSSAGEHQVLPDATHYIQRDRPDVVIAAVRRVVARLRTPVDSTGRP